MNKWYFLLLCLVMLSTPTDAASTRALTVAVDHSPPYSFFDQDGQAKGLSVELAKSLVTEAGYDFLPVACPWARCLELVETGDIDLIVGVGNTPARAQVMHFIEPAFFIGGHTIGFFTLDGQPEIHRYQDLADLIIGSLRGSLHFPEFDQDLSLHKVETKDVDTAIKLLHADRIDVLIHLEATLGQYLQRLDPDNRITAAAYKVKLEQPAYVALSRASGSEELHRALNQSMRLISASGHIEQLFQQYGLEYQ